MTDPTAFLGAGVTLGLAIVGAILWIGSLKQRLATLESKQVEEAAQRERERGAASQRTAEDAIHKQRLATAEAQIIELRAQSAALARDLGAMQIAHTRHDSTIDGLRENGDRMEARLAAMDRKLDRLLGLNGDTPAHGFVPNPRD